MAQLTPLQTMKIVLSWFFGIFFFGAGLGGMFNGEVAGVFMALLGLWFLPPLRTPVLSHISTRSPTAVSWAIGGALFVLTIVFMEVATEPSVNREQTGESVADAVVEKIVDRESDTSASEPAIDTRPPAAAEPIDVTSQPEAVAHTSAVGETVAVTAIIDGDTLRIATGESVRLIGINAPEEGQVGYHEASAALRALVQNQAVRLESDVTERDRYGRLLAYVYVDDVFANEALVRQGVAKAYAYEPDTSRQHVLRAAELAAQTDQVGLWAPDEASAGAETNAPTNTSPAGGSELVVGAFNYDSPGNDNDTMEEEFFTIKNTGSTDIDMTGYEASDSANHTYVFPSFTLAAGAAVRVRTGNGQNTASDLYWGNDGAVWNNGGDTLYLKDATGSLVLSYSY